MSIDSQLTSTNLVRAKKHVNNVCSLGLDVILIKAGTKDEFGKILTESKLTLKSFPVRFTPFDRDVKEKISWAEEVEIICYIPKKSIDDLRLSLEILKKQYVKMRHKNITYDLRFIDYYNAFANDYLYIICGGKR